MSHRKEDQAFLKVIRKSAITPPQPNKIPSKDQALKISLLLTEKMLSIDYGEQPSNWVTGVFLHT